MEESLRAAEREARQEDARLRAVREEQRDERPNGYERPTSEVGD
jgi:hypothetical protein